MSEVKFTEGPWESLPTNGSDNMRIFSGSQYIGSIGDSDLNTDPAANANLVAAAPELYEALEAAIECGMVPTSSAKEGGASRHARQVHVADMIRAALAKARGEQR